MCSLISRPASLQILPSLSECDQLAIIRASIMRFCFILSVVLILLITFIMEKVDCLPVPCDWSSKPRSGSRDDKGAGYPGGFD